MRYLFYSLFTLALVTSWVSVSGQKVQMRSVRDEVTKEILPYTNISVIGTSRGTVSNGDGKFLLSISDLPDHMEVEFSYVGYKKRKILVSDLKKMRSVLLRPTTVNLNEVEVSTKEQTVEDILQEVQDNYERNHGKRSTRQRMFTHKFERTPFPETNKINIKRSNFVGMDKDTFDEFYDLIPNEFVTYGDAIVDVYQQAGEKDTKVIPVEAISIEEGSVQELTKKIQAKLGVFFDDIKNTQQNEDTYYKFRSGIFAFKADDIDDEGEGWEEQSEDSTHYHFPLRLVKYEMMDVLKDYTTLDGDNWEFIKHPNRYDYQMGEIAVYNNDLVFPISFQPGKGTSKKKGVFKGTMYINIVDYGVHQLEFAYANGKRTEHFQMMGIGHDMLYKEGRVIFEKRDGRYVLKYIKASKHEAASIERKLSIMKKQKRFLWDKELSEIKGSVDLDFDINTSYEMLLQEIEDISEEQFKAVEEPKIIKFKREFIYSPDMWDNPSVITPTQELQQYTRK